jgi:hypothetical protein
METFNAASHNEVLQLVVQIAALLATARLLGGSPVVSNSRPSSVRSSPE